MQAKPGVETKHATVFDDRRHRPERSLVLVAGRDSRSAFAICTLSKQDRDLGAELGELERAGQKGDDRAGRSAGRTKACYGVQRWIRARLVDMSDDVDAEMALDP